MSKVTAISLNPDRKLDPPDIPEPEDDQEELSVCCGANPEGEIHDGLAICSYCGEWATFEAA